METTEHYFDYKSKIIAQIHLEKQYELNQGTNIEFIEAGIYYTNIMIISDPISMYVCLQSIFANIMELGIQHYI